MKIGLISDIHEDILSLEQAFRFFSSEKCDQIFCLGDIVGFALPFFKYIETRNANECINLIKKNCDETVIGNHDLFAIKKVPEHKFGFDYGADSLVNILFGFPYEIAIIIVGLVMIAYVLFGGMLATT